MGQWGKASARERRADTVRVRRRCHFEHCLVFEPPCGPQVPVQTMFKVAPHGKDVQKGGSTRPPGNAPGFMPNGRAVFDGFAMPEPRHEWLFRSQNLKGGTHGQCSREHRDIHVGKSLLMVGQGPPYFGIETRGMRRVQRLAQ